MRDPVLDHERQAEEEPHDRQQDRGDVSGGDEAFGAAALSGLLGHVVSLHGLLSGALTPKTGPNIRNVRDLNVCVGTRPGRAYTGGSSVSSEGGPDSTAEPARVETRPVGRAPVHETVGQRVAGGTTGPPCAPILILVADGEPQPDEYDVAWDEFWAAVAIASTEAVTAIPADHPDAQELRQFVARVRHAAGLPAMQDATPPLRRPREIQ